jgi:hypothetical protein
MGGVEEEPHATHLFFIFCNNGVLSLTLKLDHHFEAVICCRHHCDVYFMAPSPSTVGDYFRSAPATVHDEYESPTVGEQKILICFFFSTKKIHNVLNNII